MHYSLAKLFSTAVLLILICSGHAVASPNKLNAHSITIKSGIFFASFEKYKHLLNGDTCKNLTPDEITEQLDRLIIDIMITCFAFKEQDVKLNLSFVKYPNNQRALSMLKLGDIDTLAPVVWKSHIDPENSYGTIDVIQNGQFEKGVYVHEDHPMLDLPISEINLQNYTGMTMTAWVFDWQIMHELSDNILPLRHLPSRFVLLKNARADFTIMSFPSSNELSFAYEGITLKPIPGIKVVFKEGRKFIVSKKSNNGDEYFQTLNRGLKKIRKKGVIEKLYYQFGFLNEKTKDWKIINN